MKTLLDPFRNNSGFSLVDMMIILLIGVYFNKVVCSSLLSRRVAYQQNHSLLRRQKNFLDAFELQTGDLREIAEVVFGINLTPTNICNGLSCKGILVKKSRQALLVEIIGTNATERIKGARTFTQLSRTIGPKVFLIPHTLPATLSEFTVISTHAFKKWKF